MKTNPFPSLCVAAIICIILGFVCIPTAGACTRVLWNSNDLAVVVGRSMDWPESTQPILTVFPRGLSRDGGLVGITTVETNHPAQWTSIYGSLVTTIYGVGTADGVNEKGLAIHMLYLTATDFGPRDATKEGVQAGLWGQYLLDQAATVVEALKLMKQIQPLNVEVEGHQANVHLVIEDATGDSAIIEYIDGKPVIHHGPEVRVITNDPVYEEQLANLARYDFSNATRQTPLPGNVNPRDRFVRAAYYLQMLPEPKTERQAIADILAITRNVGAVRCPEQSSRHTLQHRIPNRDRSDPFVLLLRTLHCPQPDLGESGSTGFHRRCTCTNAESG